MNENVVNQTDRRNSSLANSSLETNFIGNPPTLLMRSGISIIAFIMVILLLGAYYIKYPDKITAKGVVTAQHPPIDHFSKIPGIIDSLFVYDSKVVNKGDVIAYIENDMNIRDLAILDTFITNYEKTTHIPDFLKMKIPYHLQVGELSDEYGQLVLEMEKFHSTLRQSGVFQQINTLKSEMANNKRLNQVIEKDKKYTQEELALIEKDFSRNKTLNNEGVVSDLDREKSKGQLLQYQKSYNQTDQSLIANQIKSKQLELEIQKLTESRAVLVNQHIFTIKNIIATIQKKHRIWEDTYIIKSKINGIVNIKSTIAKNRFIKQDETLATIVPDDGMKDTYASIQVPTESIGKIDKGTSAIIRFDAYPYKEYGIVRTQVSKIAILPERDKEGHLLYEVQLNLKQNALTTYNFSIPYQPLASVGVDIITEDKSILQRIFHQLSDLIKNK